MHYLTQAQIHQAIVQTLRQLGVSSPDFSIADTTLLVQDGSYVGRSFVCEHVRVIILSSAQRIEFYDGGGSILRLIRLSEPVVVRGEAA